MLRKKARALVSPQEYSRMMAAKGSEDFERFRESMRLKQAAEDSKRLLFTAQMKVFRKEA